MVCLSLITVMTCASGITLDTGTIGNGNLEHQIEAHSGDVIEGLIYGKHS